MKIAILKKNKVTKVLDLQKYLMDSIVKAHGGDFWLEVTENDNLNEGDMVRATMKKGSVTDLKIFSGGRLKDDAK